MTYDISKKKKKKKVKKKKKKNPILTGGASGGAKPLTGGAFAPPHAPPPVPPLCPNAPNVRIFYRKQNNNLWYKCVRRCDVHFVCNIRIGLLYIHVLKKPRRLARTPVTSNYAAHAYAYSPRKRATRVRPRFPHEYV